MNHEQQYWDRLAKNYDRSMRLLGGPMLRMLGLTADAVAGSQSVLEVAAGTGLVTAAIAPRVGKLVATDYAQAMVDVLRHRVEATGLTLFVLPTVYAFVYRNETTPVGPAESSV